MGLFDFLHGKEYESEAEAYMKKRNKEYARKCAEYKKQEMRDNLRLPSAKRGNANIMSTQGVKDLVNRGLNTLAMNLTGESFEDLNHDEYNGTYERKTTIYLNEQEKQDALKERLQEKYGTVYSDDCSDAEEFVNGCEDCNAPNFDKFETSLFEIQTVQKSGYVFKLCGKVVRGRFVLDDNVVVKSGNIKLNTKILQILRQGTEIDYANVASGVIVISIPANSSMMLQPGDKLTKSSVG